MKVEEKTRTETNCLGILCCAWAPGGRMERFFRVPYSLYPGYGNTLPLGQSGLSEHRQLDWGQTNVPPTFLARPGLLMPSNASDYCVDPYKRAQLMAVFSHMNPGLSLRLRKANTKDVGVQVSPRVGKSVQCSLGPRTLDSLSPWASTGHRAPASAWGVSSPVPGHWGQVQLRKALSSPVNAGQPPPPLPPPSPPLRSEEDPPEELQPREELAEGDSSSLRERKSKPAPVDSSQPLGRPNFQFLEPKYGYFHCKDCKTRWESAYVWCISGTNKVYFKQLCCKCQKSFNPYRVEAIQCQQELVEGYSRWCPPQEVTETSCFPGSWYLLHNPWLLLMEHTSVVLLGTVTMATHMQKYKSKQKSSLSRKPVVCIFFCY